MRTVYFKRGARFEIEVELIDTAGSALVVDPLDMSVQIRDSQDNLIADLDIEDVVPAEDGVYIISTDDDTSDWPLEQLKTDIKMELNGYDYYSETITIQIIKQETR